MVAAETLSYVVFFFHKMISCVRILLPDQADRVQLLRNFFPLVPCGKPFMKYDNLKSCWE